MIKIESKTEDYRLSNPALFTWKEESMRKARVMVIGCGALGNEVIKNLALLDIGYLTIIDFDHVDHSNLTKSILFRKSDADEERPKVEVVKRQVSKINPTIEVTTIFGDILYDVGLGHFQQTDVIISCVDNRLARLFINRCAFQFGKICIDGAIENLSGTVKLFGKGHGCYECSLTPDDWQMINQQIGCADIARQNIQAGHIPTTPIAASVIGALQSQEALKIIHGSIKQLRSSHLYYEGMSNTFTAFQESNLSLKTCSCHLESISPIQINLTADKTIKMLYTQMEKKDSQNPIMIKLRSPLVTSYTLENSNIIYHDSQAKHRLLRNLTVEARILDQTDTIMFNGDFDHYRLTDLGIPSADVVTAINGDGGLSYFQIL